MALCYELILAENLTIIGERMVLRPITLDDAADIYEYAGDDKVTKYVTFDTHQSVADTKESIAAYYINAPLGKYAIALKDTNKMIGAIDLRIEKEAKTAELGYILNPKFQGKGYMTEAGKLILNFAFKELTLHSVFARYISINEASGRVMERLGMHRDGLLRAQSEHKGNIVDFVYYSLLKSEYEAQI